MSKVAIIWLLIIALLVGLAAGGVSGFAVRAATENINVQNSYCYEVVKQIGPNTYSPVTFEDQFHIVCSDRPFLPDTP